MEVEDFPVAGPAGVGEHMAIITKEEKEKIKKAVEEVEKSTSGEIVPVILKQSDFYPASHFRSALFFSFIPPLVLYYSPLDVPDPIYFIWIQIPGLLIGYCLAFFSRLKRWFSTRSELTEEVHQRALQAFLNNNLHTTRDRTGILIMISLLEHRAEILADSGINDKVPPRTWKKILNPLVKKIKRGNLVDGLCEAVGACGQQLSGHFPIKEDDTNELKNDPVIKDS